MMFGVFLDVSERKLAESPRDAGGRNGAPGQEPVRDRNRTDRNFGALHGNDDRDVPGFDPAADGLGRAHDLVRPVLSEPKKAVPLGNLLATSSAL